MEQLHTLDVGSEIIPDAGDQGSGRIRAVLPWHRRRRGTSEKAEPRELGSHASPPSFRVLHDREEVLAALQDAAARDESLYDSSRRRAARYQQWIDLQRRS